MNSPRLPCFGLLTLSASAMMSGCTSPSQTSFMVNPADETKVVGKTHWVSEPDSIAIVEMDRRPYPAWTVLVALDKNDAPTAFLVTTKDAIITKHPTETYQGATILNGNVGPDQQIARPGPEFAALGQYAVDSYKAKLGPTSVAPATGTPSPTATAAKGESAVPSS